MAKKPIQTHIRKTIFMEKTVAKIIGDLAKEDSRTFSSFVALKLKEIANEPRK